MRTLLFFTFITIGIIFSGCPYESDIAIITPAEALKLDKELKGEWVAFHEDGAKEELNFIKIDKVIYQVTHKQFAPNNKLKGNFKYQVYSADLDGAILFNIKNKDGKFMFSKYGWTGKNEFYLQGVNKKFVTTNFKTDTVNTRNLREFLSENINDGKMYEEKLEFYRKYSPEYEKVKIYLHKSGF